MCKTYKGRHSKNYYFFSPSSRLLSKIKLICLAKIIHKSHHHHISIRYSAMWNNVNIHWLFQLVALHIPGDIRILIIVIIREVGSIVFFI